MFASLFCKHPSTRIEGKQLVCNKCNTSWPISRALTESSGVYARIDERLELQREHERLLKVSNEYFTDKTFDGGKGEE